MYDCTKSLYGGSIGKNPNLLIHKQCVSFLLYNPPACCVFMLLIFALPFPPSSFYFFFNCYVFIPCYFSWSSLLSFFGNLHTLCIYLLLHPSHQNICFPHSFFASHRNQFFPLFSLYSKFPFAVLYSTFLPSDTEQHLGISWELQFSYLTVQQQASFWTRVLASVICH